MTKPHAIGGIEFEQFKRMLCSSNPLERQIYEGKLAEYIDERMPDLEAWNLAASLSQSDCNKKYYLGQICNVATILNSRKGYILGMFYLSRHNQEELVKELCANASAAYPVTALALSWASSFLLAALENKRH